MVVIGGYWSGFSILVGCTGFFHIRIPPSRLRSWDDCIFSLVLAELLHELVCLVFLVGHRWLTLCFGGSGVLSQGAVFGVLVCILLLLRCYSEIHSDL